MKLTDVIKLVGNVPCMSQKQGEIIYNMILDNHITQILELGTGYGTSSCYMAAALDEKGKGSVITIDNKGALSREPNVNEMLSKCNLEKYVTPVFANSTYNWELMKIIESQTKKGICEPIFDLCYIDGAHNFEIDCCAFFLVDKLIKPGGLVLFDDLSWTYGQSPSLKNTDLVKQMDHDEKTTPHIKKLVDLIVKNHENYTEFTYLDDWVLVRKRRNAITKKNKYTTRNFSDSETSSLRKMTTHAKNKVYKMLSKRG